jgi:hypothetical protein
MNSKGNFFQGQGFVVLTNVTDDVSIVSRSFHQFIEPKQHFDSVLLEESKQYRLRVHGYVADTHAAGGGVNVHVNVPEPSSLLLLGLGLAGLARLRNSTAPRY